MSQKFKRRAGVYIEMLKEYQVLVVLQAQKKGRGQAIYKNNRTSHSQSTTLM
jgi:hypothetical protein